MLLFLPRQYSGHGRKSIADLSQLQKWGAIHRAIALGGAPEKAANSLMTRAHRLYDNPEVTCLL